MTQRFDSIDLQSGKKHNYLWKEEKTNRRGEGTGTKCR